MDEFTDSDFSALNELFTSKKHIDWSNLHDRVAFFSSLSNQEYSTVQKRIKNQFKHIIKKREFWNVFFNKAGASDYAYTARNLELAIKELIQICLNYRYQQQLKKARLSQRSQPTPPNISTLLPPTPDQTVLRNTVHLSPPPPRKSRVTRKKRLREPVLLELDSDSNSDKEEKKSPSDNDLDDFAFDYTSSSSSVSPTKGNDQEFAGIYPSFPSQDIETLLQSQKEENDETQFITLPEPQEKVEEDGVIEPLTIPSSTPTDPMPCFGYSSPEGSKDDDDDTYEPRSLSETPYNSPTLDPVTLPPLIDDDDEKEVTSILNSSSHDQIPVPPATPALFGDTSFGLGVGEFEATISNLNGISHSMPPYDGFVHFKFTREVFRTLPSTFKEGLSVYDHHHPMSYTLGVADF